MVPCVPQVYPQRTRASSQTRIYILSSYTKAARTFQAVFEAVFHHHKELLQRCIVGVERASQVESGLDQALDAQFSHVHQVEPFNGDGILWI